MQETGDSGVQILLTAKVSEYLSLIMMLIIGFGICFQLPDPVSQLALALPTLLLYEISIFAVRLVEKKRAAAAPSAAPSS